MSGFDYPMAHRLEFTESIHGHVVADPYRWLEDPADPDTEVWAAAEDALFAAVRETWPLRTRFSSRLAELLQPGGETAPVWRGQRQFLTRRRGDQEHGVLLTIEGDGAERVLLDPLDVDPAGTTTLDAWQPSKEGNLLAYQLSAGGTEDSQLWIIDVESGDVVDGPIDRVRYSPIAWVPGETQFYYVRRLAPELVPANETQFHRRVYLHQIGSAPSDDVEVFGAGGPMTTYYGVSVSRDGRWVTVSSSDGTEPRNDVWLADIGAGNTSTPEWRDVVVGVDASTSAMVGRDGRLYLFTNLDAPRGRLAYTDPMSPTPETWIDLLPEAAEAVLDDIAFLDEPSPTSPPLLLASWTQHAIAMLSVHDLATGERVGDVALPGLGSLGPIVERPEGGHEAWFNYTDFVTPPTVMRFDSHTRTLSTWAAPPDVDRRIDVVSHQMVASSSDGTLIRTFIISKAATPDRPRPTILYGYGGFRISMSPGYMASALAWVEAGGIYAVACLRGGSEEGEEWHRAGMLGNKQNVFDDFVAVAESLIATGWTSPEQLSIQGGSNGGLLVGAVLTQRPDLFASVVCSAPLLDMVRYEQFGLGRTWAPEYGTVGKSDEFEWLYAYSPYHHVTPNTPYPAVLLTVFDSDTRVDPLHARKMAAALQYASTSERPLLLRCEKDVGHSARSLSRSVGLSSDVLGFTAGSTGLTDEAVPYERDEGVA